jgi:hypothetical protein
MTLPTLPDPKEAEALARHTLTLLCDQLQENLMAGATEVSLRHQAQILEYAFAFFLREGLHAKWDAKGSLNLALKTQRQCVDTLRAETARRYMESFMPTLKTYPLPPKAPNE